ncbi:hypothetical protein Sjap_024481 [Stephania japonica]|uniref:Uncharacterized protein n=1 Tax=Stephania japonica TaxID=461633 RepID=A0AAP0HLJ0_9MAGN
MSESHTINKLMQFLMGLNEVYDHVRNEVLVMDPLPSLKKTYAIIVRVEIQKEVNIAFAPKVETTMMVKQVISKPFVSKSSVPVNSVKGGGFKKQNKDDSYYDHCKMKRNTKETCFKLYGYPDW